MREVSQTAALATMQFTMKEQVLFSLSVRLARCLGHLFRRSDMIEALDRRYL